MLFKRWVIACVAALAFVAGAGSPANSAAPPVKTQAPGYYRWMLGDFEITVLSDGTNLLPAGALLTNSTPQEIQRLLSRAYLADPVETSINALLINTGSKLVLIDTGAGDLMGPGLGKVLGNLKAAGYQPSQVDEVYLTHMHPDHIGGLLAGGQRAFPNATLRADEAEAAYWLDAAHMAGLPADAQARFRHAMQRVDPYVRAGKFLAFEDGAVLQPGIQALASHGHTPGHSSYRLESKGERLLVLGDLVHVAAVQFPNPAIALKFDYDSPAAVAQRLKAFAAAASQGTWIAGAHLPFPGIGHVRAETSGYTWLPVNYGDRF